MPHTICRDLYTIGTKSNFLNTIIEANNDLIQKELGTIHSKPCFLDDCSVKRFTIDYKKSLHSFITRLNRLYTEFEQIKREYDEKVSMGSCTTSQQDNTSSKNIGDCKLIKVSEIDEKSTITTTNESELNGGSLYELTEDEIFTDAYEPINEPINESINKLKISETDYLNSTQVNGVADIKNSTSFAQSSKSSQLNDTKILDSTLIYSNKSDCSSEQKPTKTLKRCSAMVPSLYADEFVKKDDTLIRLENPDLLNLGQNNTVTMEDECEPDLIDLTDSCNFDLDDRNVSLKNLIKDINNNYELVRDKNESALFKADSSAHSSGVVSTNRDEKIFSRINQQINLTDGMTYKCWITHVKDPLLFWIQIQDTQKINLTLEKNMNQFYENQDNNEKYKIKLIKENSFCAALYYSKWYRVKILKINKEENTAEVHYIDYGNYETVKIDELRSLASEFLSEKKLAVPLCLSNAYPKAGFEEKALKIFNDLVLNRAGEITVKANYRWPIFFCKLVVLIKENGRRVEIDALKYLTEQNVVSKKKNEIIISEFIDKIEQENKHFDLNSQFLPASQYDSSVSDFFRIPNYQADSTNTFQDQFTDCESYAQNGIYFKDYTSDFKELPQNIIKLDENSNFKFKTVKIVDPFEFYIRKNHDDIKELYLTMENKLNGFYLEIETKLAFHSKKLIFLKPDALCVVRNPVNDLFYRAIILSIDDNILVNFFDHGVTLSVNACRVLPFSKEFLNLPPYCIKCRLSSIKLPGNKCWSKEAIDIFIKLGGACNMVYEGKISGINKSIAFYLNDPVEMLFFGENQINISIELVKLRLALVSLPKHKNIDPLDQLDSVSLRKSSQRHENNSNNDKLPYNDLPAEDEEFRKNRIKEYVDFQSKFTIESEQEIELQNSLTKDETKSNPETSLALLEKDKLVNEPESDLCPSKPDHEDNLDDWNPAKEHFNSMRNTYGYNEASYEAHAYGFETKYKDNLCSNFMNTGFCKRLKCPFLHTELKEEIVSKTRPHFSVHVQQHKFVEGDMILLDLVAYDFTFYATVFGYLDKCGNQLIQTNNLKKLNYEMSKYYGNKKFLVEKSTFYAVGQIVAVKSKRSKHRYNSWFRARVCEIKYSENIDNTTLIVFLIDYGFKEEILINNVYPIKNSFLNYQEHGLQFQLADVNMDKIKDPKEFSDRVNLSNDLKIAIVKFSSNPLQVYLFDGDNERSINELLIEQGLAK